MGRRVLAFFLGFIFAFVVIAGAIAIAVFAVKVDQYAPGSDKFLGDLSHMSVYDLGKSIYQLYGEKLGMTDDEGKYYSLGQFCENYKIDVNTAFGMNVPQEVLDIPAFEFFSDGGVDRAMQQIKVSALPAVVNMFSKNEDGTGMFGSEVIAELSKYSLYDMLSNQEVGFAGVLANVRIAQLMPDSFPAEDSDNKLMWAVGQTKIGGLLNGMSGSDSILLQLKTGGAFETLGGLAVSTVLGESEYVNALMGSGAVFADLIADDGSIRLDDIINGVSVGQLLGCQKNDTLNAEEYTQEVVKDSTNGVYVKSKTEGVGENAQTLYLMSVNGEEWFEAELKCDNAEETHTHGTDCFKYVWYSTVECAKGDEHDHEASGDMFKEGKYYALTDGLYGVLAGLSITDLTSGSSDELVEELKVLKISDVMGATQVSGIMEAFVDLTIEELMNGAIDDMYLGEFFNLKRTAIQEPEKNGYDLSESAVLEVGKERDDSVLAYYVATKNADGSIAMSFDKKTWYVGKKECDVAGHDHNENCYSYEWRNKESGELAEGVQNKLASKQIADMQHLNEEIQNMTLNDVFGKDAVPSMLSSIADVKIGELSEHIDTIKLGTLLEYSYELVCTDPTNHLSESDHKHDCYVWTDKEGQPVTGMMAKLAYKTVGQLGDLSKTIQDFTLRDVLGDSIPSMLNSLADTAIGELNTAINGMYLGDFLEYKKVEKTCVNNDPEHIHDGKCQFDWYKLDCSVDHEHDDSCYSIVEGMMSKLAYNKVSELGNLNSTIQEFTLRDVLGDNIPSMLLDVADTPIKDVSDAIQEIYLGSALGYARKEVTDRTNYSSAIGDVQSDGEYLVYRFKEGEMLLDKYIKREPGQKVWYEAVRKEKEDGFHYDYVWYETDKATGEITDKEVSGIVKALVNSKVGNVSTSIETMTLGEMGIGGDPENPNRILDGLQDTKINKIGGAINEMKMATVLGYEKNYTCESTDPDHKHTDACGYVWIAECTSNHEKPTDHLESDHITIKGKTYYKVKGLNAKIANYTLKDMTGDTLTDIALNLTIGELIDSGMISLGEDANEAKENEYKLSLLFSTEETQHGFSEKVYMHEMSAGKQSFSCNLVDYGKYKACDGKANTTTKQYWDKCHLNSGLSEEALKAHTEKWKGLTLKNFVSELLKAF